MGRGIQEGATAVMEMDNTAQDQSAFTEITLEAILSRENLALALKRVEANKGAPGVDGMRTEELRDYIFEHPGELTSAILSGKYRPAKSRGMHPRPKYPINNNPTHIFQILTIKKLSTLAHLKARIIFKIDKDKTI